MDVAREVMHDILLHAERVADLNVPVVVSLGERQSSKWWNTGWRRLAR